VRVEDNPPSGYKVNTAPSANVECQGNMLVPGSSTAPTLLLSGFRITNMGGSACAFSYRVTAEGPTTLVDNGDPASLSGTTPALAPGASYEPVAAGLVIPAVRDSSQELVTYYVSVAGTLGYGISCATVVSFEPTTAVLISAFDAVEFQGGVDLTWDVISDEGLGFRIYRWVDGAPETEDITSGDLISPDARIYRDESVSGGRTYHYTLAVVLADRSEVRSQTVIVKTKAYELMLYQNSPNPFNPSTSISFTLSERARVTLSIYDVRGRLVRTLVDEVMAEGHQEHAWDGKDASGSEVGSGVYFYRLTAGKKTISKKMVMLR
jgi:hypothetical protein